MTTVDEGRKGGCGLPDEATVIREVDETAAVDLVAEFDHIVAGDCITDNVSRHQEVVAAIRKALRANFAPPVSQGGGEGELTAAFHRGVDAAKDAIRSEAANDKDGDAFFYKAIFINAIARKCGFDRATPPAEGVDERLDWKEMDKLGVALIRERIKRLERGEPDPYVKDWTDAYYGDVYFLLGLLTRATRSVSEAAEGDLISRDETKELSTPPSEL